MTAILALILSPIGRWIGGMTLALAVVGGLYLAISHHAYNRGWDRALADVKAQDASAKQAASTAQSAVDACFEREGWSWSLIAGRCQKDAP